MALRYPIIIIWKNTTSDINVILDNLKKDYFFEVDNPDDVFYLQVLVILGNRTLPSCNANMKGLQCIQSYSYIINGPHITNPQNVEIVELDRDDFMVAMAPYLF